MIEIPTVFILGAGASAPYGYSTGAGLSTKIVNEFYDKLEALLKNDSSLSETDMKLHLREAKLFLDVFEKAPVSIDKFLSINPFFSSYGKIAITLNILNEEKSSKSLKEMDSSDSKQDWYKLLFERMVSTLNNSSDFDRFRENKVAFITFNYDRSLDHFIYKSFRNTFWQSRDDFERSLNLNDFKKYIPFPLIHVYGQVDKIRWHGGSYYRDRENFDFTKIEELSHNIRVIGERSNGLKDEISEVITNHKRIFILGFGYADENLEAIGLPGPVNEEWNIYGTAKGMKEKEIKEKRYIFTHNFRDQNFTYFNPYIEDINCYELLKKYL
ncbi:MAG TPA: hypothetical protein ENI07_15720 [Desulfobacterales bacterium]|nr:hypothetical protein [Desulfobacterales bacterium]